VLSIDLATSRDEQISCELEELDLEHSTGYSGFSALSYRWGKKQAKDQVLLNGHSISIRQNLYDFLLHARDMGWTRNLWIDGLCIKQSEIPEKNQQVAKMGEIYSRATNVLIWLGPLSRLEGITLLELNNRGISYSSKIGWRPLTSSNIMKVEEGWFHSERQKLSEQGKQGLELLVQNPYWKRKWIVQEILLSGVNASLVVGAMQVQLANIVSFLYNEVNVAERTRRMNKNEEVWQSRRKLAETMRADGKIERTSDFARAASAQRDVAWETWRSDAYHAYYCCRTPVGLELLAASLTKNLVTYEPRELSSLLAEYSDFECQAPQDHIFALLSLATPESSPITVDYNADLTKLYWSLFIPQALKRDGKISNLTGENMIHTMGGRADGLRHAMHLDDIAVNRTLGQLWHGDEMTKLWNYQFTEALRNCVSHLRLTKISKFPAADRISPPLPTFELNYGEARLLPPTPAAREAISKLFRHIKDHHSSAVCGEDAPKRDFGVFDYNVVELSADLASIHDGDLYPVQTTSTGDGTFHIYDLCLASEVLKRIKFGGHHARIQHLMFQSHDKASGLSSSLLPIQKQDVMCMFSGHQPALVLRRMNVDKILLVVAVRCEPVSTEKQPRLLAVC
jgi:hypothetical protein